MLRSRLELAIKFNIIENRKAELRIDRKREQKSRQARLDFIASERICLPNVVRRSEQRVMMISDDDLGVIQSDRKT
jgi:hypothetical protein